MEQLQNMALIAVLVVVFYTAICLLIALVRALFSKKEQRCQNFKSTFLSFFVEMLNPLNWF